MVQFKVLILAKLAIISLNNSCSSQEITSNKNEIVIQNNMALKVDTIVLKSTDYELLKCDEYVYDIRLINKIEDIKNKQNIILLIEIEGKQNIAKGNKLTSSSIPVDCDLFYPTDKNNLPIITNNKMTLRKVK